jgi:wyosine [tRNA(Phe)-imidazoG37] synthetase (radical SAM superfamily)
MTSSSSFGREHVSINSLFLRPTGEANPSHSEPGQISQRFSGSLALSNQLIKNYNQVDKDSLCAVINTARREQSSGKLEWTFVEEGAYTVAMKNKHVYGPVPSRRFGLSLGVDLVPHKTCCYDCTYCQLGKTTDLTVERRDFYPVEQVLSDVESALTNGPVPDVITLAGSGEPTLYASLGKLLDGIRGLTDCPVLLLTNGGLLFRDDVAEQARKVDLFGPSLDACDPETFRRINRPHSSIDYDRMLEGLRAATWAHPGKIQLEVMLAAGINDSEESIASLAAKIGTIKADSVDINTPVRPVPERSVVPCSKSVLERAREVFGARARIIAGYSGRSVRAEPGKGNAGRILELLSRRPCTVEDIHTALGVHRNEIIKILVREKAAGRIEERPGKEETYYFSRHG